MASWLPSADTFVNLPYDPDQLSAPTTSAEYCTAYLDITLPSPTRPSLRIGVPRSRPAPYSPFPRRTLAEDIGLMRARLSCYVAQLIWCETVWLGHHVMVTLFSMWIIVLNRYVIVVFLFKIEVYFFLVLLCGETFARRNGFPPPPPVWYFIKRYIIPILIPEPGCVYA